MQDRTARILFTKALEQHYLDVALTHCVDITAIPFIQTTLASPDNIHEITDQIIQSPITAVFTSANAVNALAGGVERAQWNIYCMSGATLKAVKEKLPRSSVMAVAENASGLAAEITKDDNTPEVHFFCGNLHLQTLPDKLAIHNISVHKHIVYNTELTPVTVNEQYDAIAFFSPSAVKSYRSANTINENTILFVIGNTTSAALSDLNNKIVKSTIPETNHLIDTIIKFYKSDYVPTNN